VTVARAFRAEIEAGFRFLTDDYEMSEPQYTNRLLARVSYAGATVGYDVSLDVREGTVQIGVWRTQAGSRAEAGLEPLVERTALAPRQRVRTSADRRRALERRRRTGRVMWTSFGVHSGSLVFDRFSRDTVGVVVRKGP
jgi:hypothetical protein